MGPRSGGKRGPGSSKKGQENVKKIVGMKAVAIKTTPKPINNKMREKLNYSLPTKNSYNINEETDLSDYSDMDEDTNVNKNKNSSLPKQENKLPKNPPIIVTNKNVSAVQNMCNKVIKTKKFETKLLSIGIRVHIVEKSEHDSFCQLLQKENISFFKYHTPETRPRKIVLTGLHKMDLTELKNELAEQNVHPTDIKTLNFKNSYNYDNQCVYLLYFKPGTVKLSDLRQVKHINHIIVKWSPYSPRSHNKYPQCRNCQMYGHSSINCNMPTYCLVCAKNHKTDDCKKRIPRAVLEHKKTIGEEIDKSFIKCINCNENHTASYSGCIARKAFIEIQNRFKKNQNKKKDYQQKQNDFPEFISQENENTQQQKLDFAKAVQHTNDQNTLIQQTFIPMMTTLKNLVQQLSELIVRLSNTISGP